MKCARMLLAAAVFLMLTPIELLAQAPVVAISSATLSMDPQATDSYNLQGNFSGLSFSDAQVVVLNVGQFSALIPRENFAQQPGTNILTYQDSTGQAPYWVSSVTIDQDALTFSAAATNTVLAGLPNPFSVELGSEKGVACTMARVQATDQTNLQLTEGDGIQEPCQIPLPSQVSSPSFFVDEPTDVQFHVTVLPTPDLDPASVQLYRADANAQAMGSALCSLRDSGAASDGDDVAGDGVYSCIVHFQEGQPGPIPLLVQATAGPNRLLAPGFSLLVVTPASQDDMDAMAMVHDAATAAWEENFAAFGDSAQARVETIAAIRGQGFPGVEQIRLLEDGLSIGILHTSGVRFSIVLNRLDSKESSVEGVSGGRTGANRVGNLTATGMPMRDFAATDAPACNTPARPVVKNNKVMIWDSGFFPRPSTADILDKKLRSDIKCPTFEVDHPSASIAAAEHFAEYGTIVIDTHGHAWGADIALATSDPAPGPSLSANQEIAYAAQHGWIGMAAVPDFGCCYYLLFNQWFAQKLPPFQRTVTYVAACSSAHVARPSYGGTFTVVPRTSTLAYIFAANGGAYYGFTIPIKGTTTVKDASGKDVTVPGFSERIAPELFDHLLGEYKTVSEAYAGVDHEPNPDEQLGGKGLYRAGTPILQGYCSSQPGSPSPPTCVLQPTFVLQNDPANRLAYLGNPAIVSSIGTYSPFGVVPSTAIGLKAQLEGAVGCDGTMQYQWNNSATEGHLTPATGAGQDNFKTVDPATVYTAVGKITLGGNDDVMVDFLPDGSPPGSPKTGIRACGKVTPVIKCIAVVPGAAVGADGNTDCSYSITQAAGQWKVSATTGKSTAPYASYDFSLDSPPPTSSSPAQYLGGPTPNPAGSQHVMSVNAKSSAAGTGACTTDCYQMHWDPTIPRPNANTCPDGTIACVFNVRVYSTNPPGTPQIQLDATACKDKSNCGSISFDLY